MKYEFKLCQAFVDHKVPLLRADGEKVGYRNTHEDASGKICYYQFGTQSSWDTYGVNADGTIENKEGDMKIISVHPDAWQGKIEPWMLGGAVALVTEFGRCYVEYGSSKYGRDPKGEVFYGHLIGSGPVVWTERGEDLMSARYKYITGIYLTEEAKAALEKAKPFEITDQMVKDQVPLLDEENGKVIPVYVNRRDQVLCVCHYSEGLFYYGRDGAMDNEEIKIIGLWEDRRYC